MRKLRRIEKESVYLVTKKCHDDLFFLVPDPQADWMLLFTLIRYAQKYNLLIHGFCFMSNHFHIVLTDRDGNLPAFMREFLCNSSKALKLRWGENRAIWSNHRYSAVLLLDLDAAERKIAYTVLNPTRARLVARPKDWPGLTSAAWRVGDTITAKRPGVYFSPKSHDDEVSMRLVPVSLSFRGNVRSSEKRIRVLVESQAKSIQQDLKRLGENFAGRQAVLQTRRTHRSTHPVLAMNPRFSTRDKDLMQRAIAEDVEFHELHTAAKARYIAGDRRTVFPAGTYWYRIVLGVRVARSRRRA
jgi:REP element-mobilizing transposase RayT